ncbi:MAG: hypothetical protein AB7G21_10360 [Dehalococcoidia bacterium]
MGLLMALLIFASVFVLPLAAAGAVAWAFSRATDGWSPALRYPIVLGAAGLAASTLFLVAALFAGAWALRQIP